MRAETQKKPLSGVALTRQSGLWMVLDTPKGRGVFTDANIAAGTVLEICPVLVLPGSDLVAHGTTILNHYSYNWPSVDSKTGMPIQSQAVALGLGSLFNHSEQQNVGFRRDVARGCITYMTLRDIEAGEELCISYGSRLWFTDTDASNGTSSEVPENDLCNIEL